MNRLYNSILAVALLIMSASIVDAQNKVSISQTPNEIRTISHPENMIEINNDNQCLYLLENPGVCKTQSGTLPTHTLVVNPPTDEMWRFICVGNEDGFFDMVLPYSADHYEANLEEGTYSIFCGGNYETEEGNFNCSWVLDNVVINNDFTVDVDFSDCTYSILVEASDENGNSLTNQSFVDVAYDVRFKWLGGLSGSNIVLYNDFFSPQVPTLRFNGFDENSNISMTIAVEPGNQKSYYFVYPTIRGMEGNVTQTITPDELNSHSEIFVVNDTETDHYYHLDVRNVVNENGESYVTKEWDENLIYESGTPFTIVSNSKINDEIDFTNGPISIFMPTVYESYNPNDFNWPMYENYTSACFYFDEDGNAIKEAANMFADGKKLASFPDLFPQTSARTIYGKEECGYNGFRTPLATYYPAAYIAENTPYQVNFFEGGFFYSGEGSCERVGDYDAQLVIDAAGQLLFADSIYKFNKENRFELPDYSEIVVQAINNHIRSSEVEKTNIAEIRFAVAGDDCMPPTMTFLRVLDAYGNECIELPEIGKSSVVFGCADYNYKFNEENGRYDQLEYNSVPVVMVLYISSEGEMVPLESFENEDMFGENHGNVFVIDLAQLEGVFNNEWVSLVFSLMDEAGNSHIQILNNLFFAGQPTSVNETNTLTSIVYPNPFTNEIRINAAEAVNGSASISVFNVLGEQVYNYSMNCNDTKEFVIDGSSLNAGIYFYNIVNENGELKGRIVKE